MYVHHMVKNGVKQMPLAKLSFKCEVIWTQLGETELPYLIRKTQSQLSKITQTPKPSCRLKTSFRSATT